MNITSEEYEWWCFENADRVWVQEKNAEPLPWIGLYITLASFICFLAMTADTICGIRIKRLWFPCRFFRLNAVSLTVLTVASKLPVDLNTTLIGPGDKLAKLSSMALLANALGNFMISLGSMDNQEIVANITALGIFIITVTVNMCLHISTDDQAKKMIAEYLASMVIVLLLFITLVSSSLSLPTTKEYIEAKYSEIQVEKGGKLSLKNLKLVIKKYWVMAATGNPQFVMARSAFCAASGSLCLLSTLTLLEPILRPPVYIKSSEAFDSDYKWSTSCILVIQALGVAVGIIPPTLRWFTVVNFKFSEMGSKSYRNELKVETFWTQRLEEWRRSSIPIEIRSIKCRKFFYSTKYLILSSCIKLQILIVVSSKLLLLFYVFSLSPFLLFLKHVRRFKSESWSPTDQRGQDSEPERELDLNPYVLLLEGEALPEKTLRNIFCEVDRLILEGRRRQPKVLPQLLQGCSFYSVVDFDSDQIPSLPSQEPPSSWTLSIITLTSIALAIPNIENDIADKFLRSVKEGLPYAKLIQKFHDSSRTSGHIQKAAESVWEEVVLYHKWLGQELRSNHDGSTSKDVLHRLDKTAKSSVMEFKRSNGQMENPLNWSFAVIAANSMYRTSNNLLLQEFGDGNEITDEQLFHKLYVTVLDILASCFTNLPRFFLSMKCQCDVIEKRENSVREAALLFGETERILEIVEERQLSGMLPDEVASIDDWRASVKNRHANAMASSASAPSSEVIMYLEN